MKEKALNKLTLLAILVCSYCNAQTSDFIVSASQDTIYVDKINVTDFEVKTKTGDQKKKYKTDEIIQIARICNPCATPNPFPQPNPDGADLLRQFASLGCSPCPLFLSAYLARTKSALSDFKIIGFKRFEIRAKNVTSVYDNINFSQ
jgi:hypothetical protein